MLIFVGAVIRVYFKSRFLSKIIMETIARCVAIYIRSYIAIYVAVWLCKHRLYIPYGVSNYIAVYITYIVYVHVRIDLYSYIRSFIAVYVSGGFRGVAKGAVAPPLPAISGNIKE